LRVRVVSYYFSLWKGPDHPVNRFQWRRMERDGALPEDMLMKKKTILDYYKSRILSPRTDPITAASH
uniref:HYLS1_C domain-containing protein n=1 Tax=Heligmosomoides polygyrus TaxID=6339 RepID=A0A183GAL8_HELPZ